MQESLDTDSVIVKWCLYTSPKAEDMTRGECENLRAGPSVSYGPWPYSHCQLGSCSLLGQRAGGINGSDGAALLCAYGLYGRQTRRLCHFLWAQESLHVTLPGLKSDA